MVTTVFLQYPSCINKLSPCFNIFLHETYTNSQPQFTGLSHLHYAYNYMNSSAVTSEKHSSLGIGKFADPFTHQRFQFFKVRWKHSSFSNHECGQRMSRYPLNSGRHLCQLIRGGLVSSSFLQVPSSPPMMSQNMWRLPWRSCQIVLLARGSRGFTRYRPER